MTLLTKLIERFRDFGYRHAYVDSFMNSYIATQIKVLREQQRLTQAQLAEQAGMRQSQISAMEDVNHSSWKVSTLKKLAKALDLVLVVRFESFGSILPEIDKFGRASLERVAFAADPVFSEDDALEQVDGSATAAAQIQIGFTSASARILQFPQMTPRVEIALSVGGTEDSYRDEVVAH